MPVTMKDVAARAGVTPTVVSRVLHNKATAIRVSEATSERVRQAAIDLGYRYNAVGRMLREQQTKTIGILHGAGFGRPRFQGGSRYFAALMDGIVDGAFDNGYSLTLCPQLYGGDPGTAMSDGRFDGLVWYSTNTTEEHRKLLGQCGVPVALIHTPSAHIEGRTSSVMCDNDQGIGLGVDHLVKFGHRRIAFAYEEEDKFGEVALRLAAFRRHMQRHGLDVDPLDFIDVRLDRQGIRDYYRAGIRHTAVIGVNDGVAASFIHLAPEYQVSIPEDFSVVGFDSTAYCLESRPQLTSIRQPLEEMGRSAVNLLVQSIRGDAPARPDLVIPCGLDIRGSTTLSRIR